MKSPWQQYSHKPDGSITLEGRPDVAIEVIEEQGRVTGRDIESELGLPKYFEEWEILAKHSGLSGRQIQFIVMDQSETRFLRGIDSNRSRSRSGIAALWWALCTRSCWDSTSCARRFPPCLASSSRKTWRATTSSVKPFCLTRLWLIKPGTHSVSVSFRTCVRWCFARLTNRSARGNWSR